MNLILTCPRNFEKDAKNEIKKILKEIGDDDPSIEITKYPGILTILTKIQTEKVIDSIREKILDEPWSIRYCLRIIPIQEYIKTDMNNILKTVPKITKVIGSNDSYRITIEKRDSSLSGKEIINETAKNIPNKVSLENPNWIILIEIVGNNTGMSVIKDNFILSLPKVKRSLSD